MKKSRPREVIILSRMAVSEVVVIRNVSVIYGSVVIRFKSLHDHFQTLGNINDRIANGNL